jgi:hypothetical protein
LRLRADFASNLTNAKVGIGQLLAQARVVFPLSGESLVERECALEQVRAQASDFKRVLLPK